MHDSVPLELTAVLVFGVGAQWLAWRLKLPSILLLLVSGFLAGPVLGLIEPDHLLPGGLLPAVASLSVAVILFEGGLTLRLRELETVGRPVVRLVTVGVLVTWALGTLGARWLLGLPLGIATLLGAILVLSGPTVVGPMLRDLRPRGAAGAALKWEGIVIDPVGALLATLVLGVLVLGVEERSVAAVALDAVLTIAVGSAIGGAASALVVTVLERRWISENLQVPVTLGIVVAAFSVANYLQHEAGLIAVTILGVVLANQRRVVVEHIMIFKEHLSGLLIASLFVLLAARVSPAALAEQALPGGLLFLAWLVLVARPLSVAISTWGTVLEKRERAFLACVYPRGIVAAAVAPLFAIRLRDAGIEGAEALVPSCYLVIVGAAVVYGLGAPIASRLLGISAADPQGILLVGADPVARAIASGLDAAGVPVTLIDTSRRNVLAARLAGLDAHFGNILTEQALEEMDLAEIGRMIALTPNDEVNALAALRAAEVFGRDGVFQTPPESKEDPVDERPAAHLRGRTAFAGGLSHSALAARIEGGSVVKRTKLTESFGLEEFRDHYGASAVPLIYLVDGGRVQLAGERDDVPDEPGTVLLSLVDEPGDAPRS